MTTAATTLPPCDCLNFCGDDPRLKPGRAAKCADLLASEHRARATELLRWHDVGTELPDAEITVLVELSGDSEPVWLGYWTGGRWLNIEGLPFAGQVTGWADMPAGRGTR